MTSPSTEFREEARRWQRASWAARYSYTMTWLGRPIIQLPDDMIRLQEVVFSLKPDVIVETGIAHGGSLVYSASLCKLIGKGRVIGVDIEIRKHNRKAIEEHFLAPLITMVEGSSIAPQIVEKVRSLIHPGETVLVMLDSCHTYEHVLEELRAYGPLVSPGSYIIAADGIMKDVVGAPGSQPDWGKNNPYEAARDFLAANAGFTLEVPAFHFNESELKPEDAPTYWSGAWLKKTAI